MEEFLNFIKIIIIAIVEGITEWLPISSTGHMIIFEDILQVNNSIRSEFFDLFIIVIQLAAIVAVLISFFKKIWPFGKNKTNEEKRNTWFLLLNILIACLPAAILGLLFDDILEQYLMNTITVAITLIVYGVIFILVEYFLNKRNKDFKVEDIYKMSYKSAIIIGCAQVLAMIPGTSRSGITIIAAMLIGCNRKVAAEFSFLVAIPIMFGASGLKSVKFIIDGGSLYPIEWGYLIVGCLVAFIVSILTVKYFMKFINTKTFTPFGYYRIALGIVLIIYQIIITFVGEPSSSSESLNSISNDLKLIIYQLKNVNLNLKIPQNTII